MEDKILEILQRNIPAIAVDNITIQKVKNELMFLFITELNQIAMAQEAERKLGKITDIPSGMAVRGT